jgi:flagellar export protein FliJ
VAVLREQQKQVAQERYAAALARRTQAAMELALIDANIARSQSDWNQRVLAGPFRASDAVQTRQHGQQLQEFRKHRSGVLSKAEETLQLASTQLRKAHQACEVMSKLRDQQKERHRQDMEREERRVLDELASNSHAYGRLSAEGGVTHD